MKNTKHDQTTALGRACLAAALIAGFASPSFAIDGVVLIDQNKALVGNVTPGDLPGFPVTISQPGSYRLSGNLTGLADVDVIFISTGSVTLDLNGFSILGPVTCVIEPFGTRDRVACAPEATQNVGLGAGVRSNSSNVVVQNGSVRGMTSYGISLSGFASVVRDVTASHNGLTGINLERGAVYASAVAMNPLGIRAALIFDSNADSHDMAFAVSGLITRSASRSSFRAALSCSSGAGYSNNVLDAVSGQPTMPSCMNLGQNLCGAAPCP